MVAFISSVVLSTLSLSALAIPMPDAGLKPFTKRNGADAIASNNKFATLSPNDPCVIGQNACVQGNFAQCPNGKSVLTPCPPGTTCLALPLVNSLGTIITCTTEADKNARILATGATALANDSSLANVANAAPSPAAPSPLVAAVASPAASNASAGSEPFTLKNGKEAQAHNAKFARLTPNSPCVVDKPACVNNQFAQCPNDKFVLTPCPGGLQCAALPLVNKPGTTVTCVDQAQAIARIAATGAGSSLTGN